MKTIKKNVYYCEFCSKKGLAKFAIAKHEKYCTNNVNRECRMCDSQIGVKEITHEFKKDIKRVVVASNVFLEPQFEYKGERLKVETILELSDNCPACTLAIIRTINRYMEDFGLAMNYDYKREVSKWWQEKNSEDAYLEEQMTYLY